MIAIYILIFLLVLTVFSLIYSAIQKNKNIEELVKIHAEKLLLTKINNINKQISGFVEDEFPYLVRKYVLDFLNEEEVKDYIKLIIREERNKKENIVKVCIDGQWHEIELTDEIKKLIMM